MPSYVPGRRQTHYEIQDDIEILILLPPVRMTGLCSPVSVSYPNTDGTQGFICGRQVIYQENYSPSLVSSPLFLKNHLYLIFILCVSVHGHVHTTAYMWMSVELVKVFPLHHVSSVEVSGHT